VRKIGQKDDMRQGKIEVEGLTIFGGIPEY
jgi:hypothetical protein